MMPSVIPARLQFRCGHAALVTLPRVKGETATQRNDRVAREKSAALLRQCDFCAPVNNGNNHVTVSETIESEPVLELVVPDVQAETEPTSETIADIVTEPVTALVEEPVAEADNASVADGAGEHRVEVAPEPPVEPVAEAVVAETVDIHPRAEHATDGVTAAKPPRKPRARRQPTPSAAEIARGRRFLVEYRIERVLRADTIRDALRQVGSFGPAEVVAITRED